MRSRWWTPLKGQPRQLEDRDLERFYRGAERRKPNKTTNDLRNEIMRKNPVRWARLQRDMRWLERMARKRGLSPEEARWLL